ncbi:MAG: type IV secretion system protein [Alphaproteobacteria bacterium]|nr:type IV secretion system protein [Alphaproteobacteria bacterium]
MVEQLSSDNTKKVLLEGNASRRPIPQSNVQQRKRNADVVVENATEKRYLWTARAFAIVLGVSLCCNFILTYVIMSLVPLYRVEPFLLSFADKKEQIYNIQPIKNIYNYKYLTEIFVREYVISRNAFVNDVAEMEQRWGTGGIVKEMSSPGVYDKFRREFADKALEQIRTYNISRDIKIVSATEVGVGKQANGVWWQVEFRVEDMMPEFETPRVGVWIASVKIRYFSKTVKFGERLKNPLGFTVVDFKQVSQTSRN